jgi:uncharacterized protein (DUF58 family)
MPSPSPEVLRAIRRLEIRTRGFVDSLFSGEHGSAALGRGVEFSHVRAYEPGDDVRTIDWKVTARRGTPYVRRFVEERDLLVVLMVDVSASGRFGPGERSAGEVAAEVAAALAFSAIRRNDRIALLLVSDRVERFVPPASGRKQALRVLAHLLSDRPKGTGTELGQGFEWIARRIRERGVVFVISDFIQPGEDSGVYRRFLGQVGLRHDLVALRLASPLADGLPGVGWVEMTDPESGKRVFLDTGGRQASERYRKGVARTRAATAARLGSAGAEVVELNTARDPLPVLADFLRRRRTHR